MVTELTAHKNCIISSAFYMMMNYLLSCTVNGYGYKRLPQSSKSSIVESTFSIKYIIVRHVVCYRIGIELVFRAYRICRCMIRLMYELSKCIGDVRLGLHPYQ